VIDGTTAIGISAIIGLLMLVAYSPTQKSTREHIHVALQDAGSIVLITSIGGAFGHVLRQSGIAYAIQQQFPLVQSGTALLCAAFGITAIVRVAQGSATVAMITSIGIVGPLAASFELPFDPVYLALAIGCGSKPMPWMNDSGFWVVGRMSGMTERQTLSTFSVCLTIMGFAGFAIVLLAARVLPLVPASM
jgi:GntP family gluconate:H+ symporter